MIFSVGRHFIKIQIDGVFLSMSEKSTRREFIDKSVRIIGIAGIAGAAGMLAHRASGNAVYQVDPFKCTACDLCRTSCVLSHSAVKAVNDFEKCGY
jgi:electron transport complex protein RnfB